MDQSIEADSGSAAAAQHKPIARPNFALAIVAGMASAIVGAGLWAIVTVLTQSELGLMAIAVGFLVGYAIRFVAESEDKRLGYLGAVCALLGCVLGNYLSAVAFFAQARGLTLAQVLSVLDFDLSQRLMTATFSAMDLLFYAIAIYEGFKFSVVRRPS